MGARTSAVLDATTDRTLSPSQRRLLELLAQELLMRDPGGEALARVDDPDRLARSTAERVVDSARAWQQHLGPLYDVEGVRTLLARDGVPISRQAVSKRKLLALTTGSGRVVYPAFQFVDGRVAPGLDAVLARLPEQLVSRWTVASWLASPEAELDGERPIDVLHRGGSARVLRVAQHWAGALAA